MHAKPRPLMLLAARGSLFLCSSLSRGARPLQQLPLWFSGGWCLKSSFHMAGVSAGKASDAFQPLVVDAPKEWFAEESAPLREEMRGRMCAPPSSPIVSLLLDCRHACTVHTLCPWHTLMQSTGLVMRSLEGPLLTSSLF